MLVAELIETLPPPQCLQMLPLLNWFWAARTSEVVHSRTSCLQLDHATMLPDDGAVKWWLACNGPFKAVPLAPAPAPPPAVTFAAPVAS